MNRAVDAEHRDPAVVARDFLDLALTPTLEWLLDWRISFGWPRRTRSTAHRRRRRQFDFFSLPALEKAGLSERRAAAVLAEDPAREPAAPRRRAVRRTRDDHPALAGWDVSSGAQKEIAFTPARVLLQDFTGVPAVVDLAAMRDGIVRLGGDPQQGQPAAAGGARHRPLGPGRSLLRASTAADLNAALEFGRNKERYTFLRWGQEAFDNFRVVPPDTGIVHQVNLEYLARVIFRETCRRPRAGLPGHAGRHRLAYDDGQRPRRRRLGRRRHRGRGGDARPADLDADPRGRRLPPGRPAARRGDRHRPRPDHHRAAPQARRRRQVRRVLRPGARVPDHRRPRHARQHVAGVRRDDCDLPDRRHDARLPAADRARRGARQARRGLRQGAGAVPPRRRA